MDPAVIAVAGTLAGVMATSLTSLASTLLLQRNQKDVMREQLSQNDLRQHREELRAEFIKYLESYDAAFMKTTYALTASRSATQDPDIFWWEFAGEEMRKLQHSYLAVCITGNPDVRQAARDCLGSIWTLGRTASTGDRTEYERTKEESREPRDRLRSKMREQLNIH